MDTILSHLNSLNSRKATSGKDQFILNYEGFEPVFKRTLLVPTTDNADICIGYNENAILSHSAHDEVLTILLQESQIFML